MCEYCENGTPLITAKSLDCGINTFRSTSGHFLIAYGCDVHGSTSNGLVRKINFCPICGKRF